MSKEKNIKSTTKKSTNNKNKPKVTKIEKEVKEEKETNIEKIEKKAKKERKKIKTSIPLKERLINIFIKVDEKRKIIYGFIGGLLLGLLIMVIFIPDRIATLEDGTQPVVSVNGTNITADELYEDMKNYYSVSILLDKVDTLLLNEIYEEDDEMLENVESTAEYYINSYQSYYGYTQEEFLEKNGFSSYDDFLDYLKLDYRRSKYAEDYIEENLTDKEIENYYDENVYGDINCEHVLVSVSEDEDGLSDDDAKALAEEIIKKINDGTSWEDIQTEYKDQITYENLGYKGWNDSLESTFIDALKEMEDNTFSKEPVKTSYGYHVIYRLDQKDKESLDDVKEEIIEKMVEEKQSEDSNITYKALIQLRKDKELDFKDTVMKSKYETYCKEYE